MISRKIVIIKRYGSSKKTYVKIKIESSKNALEKKIIEKSYPMFFKLEKNTDSSKLNFVLNFSFYKKEYRPDSDAFLGGLASLRLASAFLSHLREKKNIAMVKWVDTQA